MQTVDGILKVFNKAVIKLEKLQATLQITIDDNLDEIVHLTDAVNKASREQERAQNACSKIKEFLDV